MRVSWNLYLPYSLLGENNHDSHTSRRLKYKKWKKITTSVLQHWRRYEQLKEIPINENEILKIISVDFTFVLTNINIIYVIYGRCLIYLNWSDHNQCLHILCNCLLNNPNPGLKLWDFVNYFVFPFHKSFLHFWQGWHTFEV